MNERNILVAGVLAALIIYAVTFVHEVTHVLVSFAATGMVATCPGTGLPLGANIGYILPQFYACVYPGLPGWNALVTNAVTVLIGIGLVWYGRGYTSPAVRWGTFIGGLLTWTRYGMYMSGVLYDPVFVASGVSYSLGGDGFSILSTFGPIGMVPGIILLSFGSIVTWKRIVNSRVACACGRRLGSPQNIDYREIVK